MSGRIFINSAVPQLDKLILLGDIISCVGRKQQAWEGVIGHHGVGKCKINGLLLLRTCAAYVIAFTNTILCFQTCNKTSLMHHNSKYWHLIDYIIIRTRDQRNVRVNNVVCSADCWMDHCFIISKPKPIRRLQRKKSQNDKMSAS